MCPYNSDELKQLHQVLESIIAEAVQKSWNMPVNNIIERMFDLADHGERDPNKLRLAALGLAA
jgi:hypothetical protein